VLFSLSAELLDDARFQLYYESARLTQTCFVMHKHIQGLQMLLFSNLLLTSLKWISDILCIFRLQLKWQVELSHALKWSKFIRYFYDVFCICVMTCQYLLQPVFTLIRVIVCSNNVKYTSACWWVSTVCHAKTLAVKRVATSLKYLKLYWKPNFLHHSRFPFCFFSCSDNRSTRRQSGSDWLSQVPSDSPLQGGLLLRFAHLPFLWRTLPLWVRGVRVSFVSSKVLHKKK